MIVAHSSTDFHRNLSFFPEKNTLCEKVTE